MPTLLAVRYKLFEGEEDAVEAAKSNAMHDFGGELVLDFGPGRELFVSWVSEPIQYCIGVSDATHFAADANLNEHDVSSTTMWSGLIGQDVDYAFNTVDHQILEVSSANDRLYLCSFERGGWCSDEVTVCRAVPTSA